MDPNEFAALIGRHKQILLAAKAHKGQKPSSEASRRQLELQFHAAVSREPAVTKCKPADNVAQMEHPVMVQPVQGHHVRQHFISHAYPPSTTPVSELEAITISDLRLETHHRGRVLFVRTFGHPIRLSSVQNVIEDEHGDVDKLAVYNVDPTLDPEKLLPKGAIFAIKEPFYKTTADGGVSLRVDHPSDIIRLQPLDSNIPAGLSPRFVELDKSGADWKKEGNAAYASKDYIIAVDAYSQGLSACSADDEVLKCDLLRNRAMVNLCLKRHESALSDAKNSVIAASVDNDGGAMMQLNSKAYYRAGRAAYELGQFEQAEDLFSKAQALNPDDADAAREVKRIAARLSEMTSGSYDFAKMSKAASKKHNRLDHASFIKQGAVREAGKHGRGLFATVDIKAGELILCDKAFSVAFESEEGGQTFMIINLNTERGSMGTQATLLFNTVQKMLHNPGEATRFLHLHDGGYTPKCSAQVVDGIATIDTFQAQAIIEHNCFGCPTVRSTSKDAQQQAAKDMAGLGSSGIWVTASYINHACDGNARRAFIGDMMIVRATKDIAAEQEILMPYHLADADNGITQANFQRQWGFKCDCAICTAEARSPATQRKQRAKLVEDAKQFLKTHGPSAKSQPSTATITKAEKLYAKLQDTYDKQLFHDTPRIALVSLGIWLCQVRTHKPVPSVIIATAMGVLRDLGYSVVTAGPRVQFDRTHCHLESAAIDAAMYAAQSYIAQGEPGLGLQFEGFAKELYRTLYGEVRGFEERYGNGNGR
ncbi:hypothetical protein LTR36_006019 [Oleoguttula mirabilis]|uniref:SET domain-containing protein n=1 Tax=Oleoguttula mirabilis TaxID=1507867 RepID=A0AAV9JD12_9PEZI|nr:hypothetical protein LTR36_006019 [Oleoguttula mirabilis]